MTYQPLEAHQRPMEVHNVAMLLNNSPLGLAAGLSTPPFSLKSRIGQANDCAQINADVHVEDYQSSDANME